MLWFECGFELKETGINVRRNKECWQEELPSSERKCQVLRTPRLLLVAEMDLLD